MATPANVEQEGTNGLNEKDLAVASCDTLSICSNLGDDKFSLHVQHSMTGEIVVTLDVNPDVRMRQVKKHVAEALNIPKVDLRLIMGNEVVRNGMTMKEAGFTGPDSALIQVMRTQHPQPAEFVVEREIEDNRVLRAIHMGQYTEDDIEDYARCLGMDPDEDAEFLYLAKEGLEMPLDPPWRHCESADGELFYFNFETGESSWDHPNDEDLRLRFQALKAQRGPV
eukprot:TRINITY_DN1624_c0_g3_i1.p2 TRINITY_DN1624_c0_g3~~TRINITY_DN1624_c0_g3_i1.p2  ORF type:complete len:225 (-),score=49.62 TRINITY_DN1624_c0_g3_i1:243-917(-)